MPKTVGGYELGPTIGVGVMGKIRIASTNFLNPLFDASPIIRRCGGNTTTGSGSSGPNSTGVRFAVRQIEKEYVRAERGDEKMKRDIANIKKVHHPHIATTYEVLRTSSNLYIVTDLAPNATSILKRVLQFGKMDEPDAREVFQRAVCALRFCHKKKIPHRNIKPSMILLVPNPTPTNTQSERPQRNRGLSSSAASTRSVSGTSRGGGGGVHSAATGTGPTLMTHTILMSGLGLASVRKPPIHAILNTVGGLDAAGVGLTEPAANNSNTAAAGGSNHQHNSNTNKSALITPSVPIISPTNQNAISFPSAPPLVPRGPPNGDGSSPTSPSAVASPTPQLTRHQMALASLFQHPFYAPPEALKDPIYDPYLADVWSLGVLLYFMLSAALPFDCTTMADLMHATETGDFRMPRYFTDSAKRLVARMLTVEPRKRITMDELLSDPWFVIDFNSALIDLGEYEVRPAPVPEDFEVHAQQRRLLIGLQGSGAASGHHLAAGLHNSSFGVSTAGTPQSPQSSKSGRFAVPSSDGPSSAGGGGGGGGFNSSFSTRSGNMPDPHSGQGHHQHQAMGGAQNGTLNNTLSSGAAGGGKQPSALAYLRMTPTPLDGFGIVLRMLATNFADIVTGGSGSSRGPSQLLLTSTLMGANSPLRRRGGGGGGGGGRGGVSGGAGLDADALIAASPMLHASLRRSFILANTAAVGKGPNAAEGSAAAGGGGGGNTHKDASKSGGGGGPPAAGGGFGGGGAPNPFGVINANAGGPRQDLMTAMQSLRCHPQLGDDGDITGYFIGGKQGQLDIRVRVTSTVVSTLYLVVVMAERGGVTDFNAFFNQLQQTLGLAVVSRQGEPSEMLNTF